MQIKFSSIIVFSVILLLGGALTVVRAQKLISFAEGEKLGYKDVRGKVVIPARFVMAGDFSKKGLAVVVDEQGWALINRAGEVVVRTPFIFDGGPDDFAEGLARLTLGGKFGFFDETGATIVAPQFDFALPFSEGAAAVCAGCRKTAADGDGHYGISGGRWGYINRRGRIIISLQYEQAENFKNGRAHVTLGGKSRYINQKGGTFKAVSGKFANGAE